MTHALPISPIGQRRRAAFSLVELLIAIGIIVLMLGLAMPAFRVITGGRSEQGAANQVAAMLNRARADAVGLQVPRGVAFYTDAAGQCRMAEVGSVAFPAWQGNLTPYSIGSYVSSTTAVVPITTTYYVCIRTVPANLGIAANLPLPNNPATDTAYWHIFADSSGNPIPSPPSPVVLTNAYYTSDPYFASSGLFYDQLPDTDPVPLPLGIAAQVIVDSKAPVGTARTTDAYLHDGLILFDANGRMVSQSFVVSHYGLLGTSIGLVDSNNKALNVAINATTSPPLSSTAYIPPQPLSSSFGLVLFDRDAHDNQNFPAHDPTLDSTAPAYGTAGGSTLTPADEEAWLDVNATPLLINRYNGTLIRGE